VDVLLGLGSHHGIRGILLREVVRIDGSGVDAIRVHRESVPTITPPAVLPE
jgi:hypothetical protein